MTCLLWAIGFALPANAQVGTRSGSIAGTIVDGTRAALPGVTVVLTSPALQVREVDRISNASGEYQFLDLPLGTYTLSFDLPGFTRLVRDNITLTTGFAAKIDVVLTVASIAETVTVRGESPVVDVTNTRGGAVLNNDMLETIPTSKTINDMQSLTPGMVPGAPSQIGQISFGALASGYRSYGISGQERVSIDGINIQNNEAPDFASAEEVVTKTFGGTADTPTPGAQIELVVKTGGNQFHGRYKEEDTNHRFDSKNVDDKLRAQGISVGDSLWRSHDFVGDLGGRIVRDKLWFYGAGRDQSNTLTVAGYAQAPGPDGQYGTADDIPGQPPNTNREVTGKASYQATRSQRIVGLYNASLSDNKQALASRFQPKESTQRDRYYNWRAKVDWQASFGSRLLATMTYGNSWYLVHYETQPEAQSKPATLDRETQIVTGVNFSSNQSDVQRRRFNRQWNGTLSYSLGSHDLKTGFNVWRQGTQTDAPSLAPGNYQLVFDRVGGLPHQPVQINIWNRPTGGGSNLNYYAGYLMDGWRISRRITSNLGLRWDRSVTFVPASIKPAGPFGPAATFPRIEAGKWANFAPRGGVAIDITGDSKNVVKVTYGWFNHDFGDGFAGTYDKNSTNSTSYRWTDPNRNGNYDPGEVNLSLTGPDLISAPGVTNTIINPDLRQPHTHEISVSFERQLASAISTRVLYVHQRQVDLIQTINPLRPYSAFDTPIVRQDPGPDGTLGTPDDGGSVTIYDYNSAFRGGTFEGQERVNTDTADFANSFEAMLAKRSSDRWSTMTSMLLTKSHRSLSSTPQSPNDLYFPLDTTLAWSYRLTGSYRLPYDLNLSGLYTVLNGTKGQRTYTFRSIPNLSTRSIRLEPYGDSAAPARPSLNIRAAKRFRMKSSRNLDLSFDAINAFNANTPWSTTYTSGPTFGYASTIAGPRTLRFGAAFSF
jgi:hypothetical protein